jgi:predicted nucleotide-binding protein (sugar kinase/HSP70/actin superfamily)
MGFYIEKKFIQPMINFLVSDEITRGDFFFHKKNKKNALLGLTNSILIFLLFPLLRFFFLENKLSVVRSMQKKKEVDGQTLLYSFRSMHQA